jgi:citrate synthase
MITDPEQKIARPRQVWIGHETREFVPMEKRGVTEAVLQK